MNFFRAKPRLPLSACVLTGAWLCVAVPVVAQTSSLPQPVTIGEGTAAQKSDVAPVTIGEGAEAQKTNVAPVKIGEGTAPEKSAVAPVKVGGAVAAAPAGLAAVKVGGAVAAAPSGLAAVKVGGTVAAAPSGLAALKVGGVAASANPGLAAITGSSLRVPLLVGQVSAGATSVEALLQSEALKPADLVWAMHHPLLWQQKAPQRAATPSTIAVYDAFLARFDDQVADAVSWEPQARAALAAELLRRGDARCVPLFQAMTAQWVEGWQRDGGRKIDGAIPGLHELAWYYQDNGEPLKAAQMYELSERYSVNPVWVSNALLEAARHYRDAGQSEKSEALYARVEKYGEAWTTGLALYDQSDDLIKQGRFKEAQSLLKSLFRVQGAENDSAVAIGAMPVPVGVPASATPAPLIFKLKGPRAEPITVALLSLLAYSYYLSGEFDFARQYALQSSALYESLANPLSFEGLKFQKERDDKILSWIELWKTQPILVEPKELRVMGRWREEFTWTFLIQTHSAVPLSITIDNPKVHLRKIGDPPQTKTYFSEKEVEVEVKREDMNDSLEATIVVSSPQIPNFSVRVPLSIKVPK